MTLGVESANVCRNSRRSEVLTHARTADVQSLARAVTIDVGSADFVSSADAWPSGWLWCALASAVPAVGSPDVRQDFRR
jgi:hypothetical protein